MMEYCIWYNTNSYYNFTFKINSNVSTTNIPVNANVNLIVLIVWFSANKIVLISINNVIIILICLIVIRVNSGVVVNMVHVIYLMYSAGNQENKL